MELQRKIHQFTELVEDIKTYLSLMDKEKEVYMDILNWTKLLINLIELFNLPLYLLTISMESSQAIREKSIKFSQMLAFKMQ